MERAMRMKVVAGLLIGCATRAGFAELPVEPVATRSAESIRTRVAGLSERAPIWREAMEARGIAGMAVVVVLGDEVVFTDTFGVRDPDRKLPVTSDTMFYIASCTKSYVATAIMTLVEDGKVALDAPVKKYLPRFELADADATRNLTVRDLLSHAKGLDSGPAVFLDAFTGEITEDRYYYCLRQAKPSGRFEYTNVHYTLLGRIIEAVTGESWKDYLEHRVLRSAGMTRTTAYAGRMYGDSDHAVPCEHDGTRIAPAPVRKNDRVMHAAGGLGASVSELGRWLRLHLNGGSIDGRMILSSAGVAEMRRLQETGSMPDRMADRTREGYGLGWFIGKYHDIPIVDHGGGYVGTAATISFMHDYHLGVAVVANGSSSLVERVAVDIFDRLLDLPTTDRFTPLMEASKRQLRRMKKWNERLAKNPVDAAKLSLPIDAYVGTYRNEQWGTAAVDLVDGALQARVGDLPLRISAIDTDRFRVNAMPGANETGRFVVDANKKVFAFIYDGRDSAEIRFERE